MTIETQNIPVRYKQTEVGVIPEDWEVYALGEIGKFKNGLNKDSQAFGHGSPFVNLMDVFGVNSIASIDQLGLVMCSNFEQSIYDLRQGDVLFIRSSVKPSGVGLTAVIENDLHGTVYSGFIIRFRDGGFIDATLKKHCFYEEGFRKRVISSSSVSANTNINQDSLKRISIALPSIKAEQIVIATALSDIDALIGKLAKLVEKKQKIKQGAMQELLTGKRRLPGFSGKWELKMLGQIATVVGGGTPSTYVLNYWNGKINWFTPTEIGLYKYTYSSLRKISEEGLKNCSAKILPKGTILLTTRAGIGDVSILMNESCTNQGFQSLVANDDTSYEFLYYLVLTLKNVLIQNASGSTFLEISPNRIKQIEVKIPDLKEQTAIATILSDIDIEIEKLELQLRKYQNIKQGMMQTLLTGKIRLI